MKQTRIVLISDTHEMHRKVQIPECDILIHAGDITFNGELAALTDFNKWMGEQPAKHKVAIAGNHDLSLDPENPHYSLLQHHLGHKPEDLFTNFTYLNDSGCEIEGLTIWGSPIQPWFHNWAFNRMRGEEINEHWKLIPEGTDILVTHGPPLGVLDVPGRKGSNHVGCADLAKRVDIVRPKLMVFGHIHGGYGMEPDAERHIWFVNASVVNEAYRVVNEPIKALYDDNGISLKIPFRGDNEKTTDDFNYGYTGNV